MPNLGRPRQCMGQNWGRGNYLGNSMLFDATLLLHVQ